LLLRALIEAAFPPGRAPRIRAVGGNHDIVADVAAVFPARPDDEESWSLVEVEEDGHARAAAAAAAAASGGGAAPSTCFVEQAAAGWLVLGLDTVDVRSPHGGAGGGGTTDEELGWLERQLAANSGRGTVIFMHHPPVPGE
jgi:hypothetical protein